VRDPLVGAVVLRILQDVFREGLDEFIPAVADRVRCYPSTMADVDRPGIRIAVQANSGPDSFFFAHARKCCDGPRIKQSPRIGSAQIGESRRNGQHQASPVRDVESIA